MLNIYFQMTEAFPLAKIHSVIYTDHFYSTATVPICMQNYRKSYSETVHM